MMQIKGVVIYQFTTKKGTWIQLKSKTWVYVPGVISSSLIGAYIKFEGQKKNYREKSFFYSNSYEILQDFDFQNAFLIIEKDLFQSLFYWKYLSDLLKKRASSKIEGYGIRRNPF